ncbi:MAG: type 1 glutamine amidotransferase domain-containing protein [Phycisphaerae bacterium]
MKALILTADGYEDSELLYPYYRMIEEQIEVDIAAPESGSVTGKHGYTVEANKSFDQINADDYQMLILPGGSGPETVRLNDKAVATAKQFMEQKKPVASICHGIQTLISADAIQGRNVTCWHGIKDDTIAAGATFEDEKVVIDDNLITSRMPDDLPAFARAIIQYLQKSDQLKPTLASAKHTG